MVCNKKRKPVFIKRKWNHVVFSWVTILSFHENLANNRITLESIYLNKRYTRRVKLYVQISTLAPIWSDFIRKLKVRYHKEARKQTGFGTEGNRKIHTGDIIKPDTSQGLQSSELVQKSRGLQEIENDQLKTSLMIGYEIAKCFGTILKRRTITGYKYRVASNEENDGPFGA